eukprot:6114429-Pleurochrysis_carterae.AAC.3
MASKPLSKNRSSPRVRNRTPAHVSPMPISAEASTPEVDKTQHQSTEQSSMEGQSQLPGQDWRLPTLAVAETANHSDPFDQTGSGSGHATWQGSWQIVQGWNFSSLVNLRPINDDREACEPSGLAQRASRPREESGSSASYYKIVLLQVVIQHHPTCPAAMAVLALVAAAMHSHVVAGAVTNMQMVRMATMPAPRAMTRLGLAAEDMGIPCEGECAIGEYPKMPASVHPGVVTGQVIASTGVVP